MNTTTEKKLMSITEAQRLTGIERQTWHKWVKEGRIPHTQPGGPRGKVFISPEVVERMVAEVSLNPRLAIERVAEMTGLSVETCKRLVKAGVLHPQYKMVGAEPVGSPKFRASEVTEWWNQDPITPVPSNTVAEDVDEWWMTRPPTSPAGCSKTPTRSRRGTAPSPTPGGEPR